MKKPAYFGLFLALALICSYVEMLIPFYFGIPGVKLGLANIVIVLILYYMGPKAAITLSVLRILLAGFLFGNVISILYSLAGGLLSFIAMAFLKRTGKFSLLSISAAGGIMHNFGQVTVAAVMVENLNLFYYYPVLLLAGLVTGILVGIAAQEILLRLPAGNFEK